MASPEELTSWGLRAPFISATPLASIGLHLRWGVEDSPVFAALRAEGHIESTALVQAFRVVKKPMLILIGWTMAPSSGGLPPNVVVGVVHEHGGEVSTSTGPMKVIQND
ncbi:hypothetical protein [Nocardia sp. NPDC004711]